MGNSESLWQPDPSRPSDPQPHVYATPPCVTATEWLHPPATAQGGESLDQSPCAESEESRKKGSECDLKKKESLVRERLGSYD